MFRIFGYGEDALTLWALKQHTSKILDEYQDKTPISDCLIFYRPSFGRHSKANSSVFGEFDSILASRENIYLIESKWDNLAKFTNDELILREEQSLRHKIFSWYLTHWNSEYYNNWQTFIKEQGRDFRFNNKRIAPNGSLLAKNLELVLNGLHENCRNHPTEKNVKNVLLFFYNVKNSTPPTKTSSMFRIVPIEYGKDFPNSLITLS